MTLAATRIKHCILYRETNNISAIVEVSLQGILLRAGANEQQFHGLGTAHSGHVPSCSSLYNLIGCFSMKTIFQCFPDHNTKGSLGLCRSDREICVGQNRRKGGPVAVNYRHKTTKHLAENGVWIFAFKKL